MNPDSYRDEKLRFGSIQISIYDSRITKKIVKSRTLLLTNYQFPKEETAPLPSK